MSVIVRNSITGVRKEMGLLERQTTDFLFTSSLDEHQPLMLKFQYSGDAKDEVFVKVSNVVVDKVNFSSKTPKVDCYGFSPSAINILNLFRTSASNSYSQSTGKRVSVIQKNTSSSMEVQPGVFRFVLKKNWYRVVDKDGNSMKLSQDELQKKLASGAIINMEFHLNFLRTYVAPSKQESIIFHPIVRKIQFIE